MKLRSDVHAFFVHIERKLAWTDSKSKARNSKLLHSYVLNIYNKSWKYEDFCLIINARN